MIVGRAGTRRSAKRRAILRATQPVVLGEGYASVTFERVTSVAGVTKGLVYYYFSTLDELFIAVLQDSMDHFLARMTAATAPAAALRTAWAYAGDQTGTALMVEFLALANHRSEVRAAIGECAERARRALTQVLGANLSDGRMFAMASGSAAAFMLTCIPRLIAMEELVGADLGHSDAMAAGQKLLEVAEGPQKLRG